MHRFVIKQGRKSNEQKQNSVGNEGDKDLKQMTQNSDAGEGTREQTAGAQLKKRKVRAIQDEYRKFQDKWTDDFLFVLHGSNPLCLLCNQTRSGFKRSNLERHFQTTHPKFYETYAPGNELRRRKIEQLTASLSEQQKLLHRTTTAERLTEASFEIAWILARMQS